MVNSEENQLNVWQNLFKKIVNFKSNDMFLVSLLLNYCDNVNDWIRCKA